MYYKSKMSSIHVRGRYRLEATPKKLLDHDLYDPSFNSEMVHEIQMLFATQQNLLRMRYKNGTSSMMPQQMKYNDKNEISVQNLNSLTKGYFLDNCHLKY